MIKLVFNQIDKGFYVMFSVSLGGEKVQPCAVSKTIR